MTIEDILEDQRTALQDGDINRALDLLDEIKVQLSKPGRGSASKHYDQLIESLENARSERSQPVVSVMG